MIFTWVWKLQAGAVLRAWCCRCSDRSSHFAFWMYDLHRRWHACAGHPPSPFHRLLLPAPFVSLPNTFPSYPRHRIAEALGPREAMQKIKAGLDFPLQTRNGLDWDGVLVSHDFSRMDYRNLWSTSWVQPYSEGRKGWKEEKGIWESYLRGIVWVSLLTAAVTFQVNAFPLQDPLSPLDSYFSRIPVLVLVFLGGGMGVALELTKLSIRPLLCCSDLNFLASLSSPLPPSPNAHE